MLAELRNLPPQSKISLIGEFEPKLALDLLSAGAPQDDSALWAALVATLRQSCLQARESEDLAQALRNRLRQVATEAPTFIVQPDATDAMTDMDLAYAIVGYALQAATKVEDDDVETFFRTKKADGKQSQAEAQAAYARIRAAFADEFGEEPPDLDAADIRRAAGSAAVAPALAALALGPIGAMAGAAFVSGLMIRKATKSAPGPGDSRSSRARKSKLFQDVVRLSLFMVTEEARRAGAGT